MIADSKALRRALEMEARPDEPIAVETFGSGWRAAIERALEIVDQHEARTEANKLAGRAEVKAAGHHLGGDVPYGYQLGADGLTLEAHIEERRTIALAQDLRRQGLSYAAIAARLTDLGRRARSGDAFESMQVYRMLAPDGEPTPTAPTAPRLQGTRRRRRVTSKRGGR